VNEHLWGLANELVPSERPGDFNQAMMELGATICLPKNPKCKVCPVKEFCVALSQAESRSVVSKLKVKQEEQDDVQSDELTDIEDCTDFLSLSTPWNPELGVMNYPQKMKKKEPKKEYVAVAVFELLSLGSKSSKSSAWLLTKRPDKGLLANLWEFTNQQVKCDEPKASKKPNQNTPNESFINASLKKVGDRVLTEIGRENYEVQSRSLRGNITHIFSHILQHNYIEHIQLKRIGTDDAPLPELVNKRPCCWMSNDDINKGAVSSAVLKILNLCCDATSKSSKRKSSGKDAPSNKKKKSSTKKQTKGIAAYFKPKVEMVDD